MRTTLTITDVPASWQLFPPPGNCSRLLATAPATDARGGPARHTRGRGPGGQRRDGVT
ncbi:hypothetical protein FRAAL5118 [Frankia alni ACN14a]|uniref:Uncharacterized protein n=1 Tax=Frankia alni (strain DSM 45986 / CECT 9034 / ACN14a) TaxID=326424 RepID=Q0RFI5_FRAAA|nr:hypothetical protein FRAAL5118 [Frankia alni ACN14a]